jgi:hypothetical protein
MRRSLPSSSVHVSSGQFKIPLRPHYRWVICFSGELGGMIFSIEPMVLPTGKVGGEFV